MKKRRNLRILSFCLLLTVMLSAIIPLTAVNSKAAESTPSSFVSAPSSSVGISKTHVCFEKLGSLFSALNSADKGIVALANAAKNYDGTVSGFLALYLSYYTGNSECLEITDGLLDAMLEIFRALNGMITELVAETDKLDAEMKRLKEELNNTSAYTYLLGLVDKYTALSDHYESLTETYAAIERLKDSENVSSSEFGQKMDILYSLVLSLEELPSIIADQNSPYGETLIDAYCDYVFSSSGITSADHPLFNEKKEKCQEIALGLLAQNVFYRYLSAFVSSYHLCYISNVGEEYYLVDSANVTLPITKSYKIFKSDAEKRLSDANGISVDVKASLADTLVNLDSLSAYCGYSENGAEYYASVREGAITAYSGATYRFYAIPSELSRVLGDEFSFKLDGSYGDSILSSTGNLTVLAPVGSGFTLSYLYGESLTEEPRLLYKINITVGEQRFSGGYGNTEAPYLIGNAEEILSYFTSTDLHGDGIHAKLISDIDLTGKDITPIESFYGTLDGGGFKIKGLNTDSAIVDKNYGTLKNLTVDSAVFYRRDSDSIALGALANVNEGIIENCHVKDSSFEIYTYKSSFKDGKDSSVESRLGALTGKNCGAISASSVTDSTVKASTSVDEPYLNGEYGNNGTNTDITTYTRIYIGGIAGVSDGEIKGCYVGKLTLNSLTKATYYKDFDPWNTVYNKVDATVRHGAVAGYSTGENTNNLYFDINDTNTSHVIRERAAKKEADVSEVFVTGSIRAGVRGEETDKTAPDDYVRYITVTALPFTSSYKSGSEFNSSGIEIRDNNGASVYGFTVHGIEILDNGALKLTVSYLGMNAELDVMAKCLHEITKVIEGVLPTCKTDGCHARYVCARCGETVSGGEIIRLGEQYCKDENNDHACDTCERVLSTCRDNDFDHGCDICKDVLSVCNDSDCDHRCDICKKDISECTDSDDHECDTCGTVLSYCEDKSLDHLCDICKKRLSDCYDSSDHLCDTCGDILSTCNDKDTDHKCDLCKRTLSECKDESLDHKCDYCGKMTSECEDKDSDHLCDLCKKELSLCLDTIPDHLCDLCAKQLSECSDSDDHKCDTCAEMLSVCEDTDGDHKCELCKKTVTECDDKDRDHKCDTCGEMMTDCSDADSDHFCDLCKKEISLCTDDRGDHKCDICGKTVSECFDSDDHKCDICESILSYCEDTDNDHKCELCKTVISECKDQSRDHRCDVCGDVLSQCYDNNDHKCDTCERVLSACHDTVGDHLCDVCTKPLSDCFDTDDHRCDICGRTASSCSDLTRDHSCDVCKAVISSCTDTNGDYLCDVCSEELCIHSDTDGDHFCNVCTRRCSDCSDTLFDHLCDLCGKRISACIEEDDHYCSLCGEKVSECYDRGGDHRCDVCNKVIGACEDILMDHRCDSCDRVMSEHRDRDSDHQCDTCGIKCSEHTDGDDHKCDVCEVVISSCQNADSDDHLCDTCGKSLRECADTNDDHRCDVCGKRISDCYDKNDHKCDLCEDTLSECTDTDNDHKCNVCGRTVSDCVDKIADHKCDICGKISSVCLDAIPDHKCDVCASKLSECTDSDDHKCDLCEETVSECEDKTRDHLCDVCGTAVTYCIDASPMDHLCDICTSSLSEHVDVNRDHLCDICESKVSEHTVKSGHACELCFVRITPCTDENADHKCDVCDLQLTECQDVNRDHICDLCARCISKHTDGNGDGECDLCFTDLKNHKDDNADRLCDVCGDEWKPSKMPIWSYILIGIGSVGVLSCGGVLIYKLTVKKKKQAS